MSCQVHNVGHLQHVMIIVIVIILDVFSQRVIITLEADAWLACNTYCVCRVAELGSLSSGAKMAMKIFVKRVFTIFASNVSFLRVIANLQN